MLLRGAQISVTHVRIAVRASKVKFLSTK